MIDRIHGRASLLGDVGVTVGRISGIFGLQGWVKVHSYTNPRANLFRYQPWFIGETNAFQERELLTGKPHGKGLVALLAGCTDPATAQPLIGQMIAVPRDRFPALDEGEYYWSDLIDLQVVTLQGVELGRVNYLIETGANDVLVIHGERERLIPYLPGQVICEVDLRGGRLVVDWDPEF